MRQTHIGWREAVRRFRRPHRREAELGIGVVEAALELVEEHMGERFSKIFLRISDTGLSGARIGAGRPSIPRKCDGLSAYK
jgi:hypothetical protein